MANHPTIKYSYNIRPFQISPKDFDQAVQDYISKGGEILNLRDDNGGYDKGLKKIQENLIGGFNPFSKEQALKKR